MAITLPTYQASTANQLYAYDINTGSNAPGGVTFVLSRNDAPTNYLDYDLLLGRAVRFE